MDRSTKLFSDLYICSWIFYIPEKLFFRRRFDKFILLFCTLRYYSYIIYLIFLYYIFDFVLYTCNSFVYRSDGRVWRQILCKTIIMSFLSMLFLWHTDRHGQSFYYTCAAKPHLSVSRLSVWRRSRAEFPQRRCQALDTCLDHLFRRSKIDNRSFFRLYLTYNDLIYMRMHHYVTIFISFLIFITLILHAIKQKAWKLTLLKVKIQIFEYMYALWAKF